MLVLACAAATAAALSGCGAGSTGSATAGGGAAAQTLTVQYEQGDNTIADALAKGFEAANPGTKVNLQAVANDAKNGSNLAVITSSSPPDVALVPTNSTSYQSLVDNNGLVDLESVRQAASLDKRQAATTLATGVYKDKLYAVAYRNGFYSLVVYNKDLFEQAGITAPADHRIASEADLSAMAAALKKIGKKPLLMAGGSGFQASWMVDALLPSSASDDQLLNYLSSWRSTVPVSAKYTDPAFVDVMSELKQFADDGVYQDGFLGQKLTATEAAFTAGSAGMIIDGSWFFANAKKSNASLNMDWMLLPPVDSSKKSVLISSAMAELAIPSGAKNKELAEKYLEYVVSVAGQTQVVESGSLPGVNDFPSSGLQGLQPEVQELVSDAAASGTSAGWTGVVPAALGQTFTDPLIQSMYAGKLTPDQVGTQVQGALDTIRQ